MKETKAKASPHVHEFKVSDRICLHCGEYVEVSLAEFEALQDSIQASANETNMVLLERYNEILELKADRDRLQKQFEKETLETWNRGEEIRRLCEALEFYEGKGGIKAGHIEWNPHVCDKYSGLGYAPDWDGNVQDEPWEVASRALASRSPKGDGV